MCAAQRFPDADWWAERRMIPFIRFRGKPSIALTGALMISVFPACAVGEVVKCIAADGSVYFGDSSRPSSDCTTVTVDPRANVIQSFSEQRPVSGENVSDNTSVLVRPAVIYKKHRRGASAERMEAAERKKLACLEDAMRRIGQGRGYPSMVNICNAYTRGLRSEIVELPETMTCDHNWNCSGEEWCVRGAPNDSGVCGVPVDARNVPLSPEDTDWLQGTACGSHAQCPASFKCQVIRGTTRKICMTFHR